MKLFIQKNAIPFSFVLSLVGTLGSLYFSEIQHFPPCTLCWYQRIFLFPLVFIFLVGIIRKDKNVPYYALPISIIGLITAIYHNLLYYNILPESIAPCTTGVSCTTQFIEWFGFVTIPFLSLLAFAGITAAMIAILRVNRK